MPRVGLHNPPVAIAAYAGASIAGAGPLRTGFMAIRIGAAILLVPFVFVYYPELFLVGAFFPDLPLVHEMGPFSVAAFISILVRFVAGIWLLTSAFSMFDATELRFPEVVLRAVLMFLLLMVDPLIHWPAFGAAVLVIGYNYLRAHRLALVKPA